MKNIYLYKLKSQAKKDAMAFSLQKTYKNINLFVPILE
jgi:hypothetical protein